MIFLRSKLGTTLLTLSSLLLLFNKTFANDIARQECFDSKPRTIQSGYFDSMIQPFSQIFASLAPTVPLTIFSTSFSIAPVTIPPLWPPKEQSRALSDSELSRIKGRLNKINGYSPRFLEDNFLCLPGNDYGETDGVAPCTVAKLFLSKVEAKEWNKQSSAEFLNDEGMPLSVRSSPSNDYITFAHWNKGHALRDFATRHGIPMSKILKFGDSPHGDDKELLIGLANAFDVSFSASTMRQGKKLFGLDRVCEVIEEARGKSELIAIATDYDDTIADGYLSQKGANMLIKLLNNGVKIAIITANEPSVIVPSLAHSLSTDSLNVGASKKNLEVYFYNGNLYWAGGKLVDEIAKYQKDNPN